MARPTKARMGIARTELGLRLCASWPALVRARLPLRDLTRLAAHLSTFHRRTSTRFPVRSEAKLLWMAELFLSMTDAARPTCWDVVSGWSWIDSDWPWSQEAPAIDPRPTAWERILGGEEVASRALALRLPDLPSATVHPDAALSESRRVAVGVGGA